MNQKTEIVPSAASSAEVVTPLDLNKDKYDALIDLADRIENVVLAQIKIRTSLLKMAMPGDFVQFGEKIELSGPGADRIAAAIGMNVTSIHDDKTSWEDAHGKAYTWRYIGDVSLGKRIIEGVEGRAGSRDKFFGFENSKWKELQDVRESDIRTAARRSLYKEGVKLLLGLRSLPSDPKFLESIGLDPSKVKRVEFGGRGETKIAAPIGDVAFTIKEVKAYAKKDGDKVAWTRYDVFVVESEAKFATFDKKIAEAAEKLRAAGTKVFIRSEASAKGNTIIEIVPAVEAEAMA